ncbi:ClpXP protease specificity-enhancing factor [Aliagarivorans taiwanensis]|uniref:ClpXP protease specificity-enhancing factor n=1 Tax=Aliagarivorans taiwanensis TaxID=561966 RepID=UPI000414F9B1|nr:ClpXP protease specificity-enhancing factor [Aliagarivorans taiwanensis]
MTPNRPYLLRAFYDWLLDNELTPHLVVDATRPYVNVPQQFVENGQIVLNIAPSAIVSFNMDLEQLSFNARFGGQPFEVYVPMAAVIAIYARENGAGTVFDSEPAYDQAEELIEEVEMAEEVSPEPETKPRRPSLRVVK